MLCFGAPVWATSLVAHGSTTEHKVLKPLLVSHRGGLKKLLGLKRSTRTVLVHIISARPPLLATLMKLCRRYFAGVDVPIEQAGADPNVVLRKLYTWAGQQDYRQGTLTLQDGRGLLQCLGSNQEPYNLC